MANFIGDDSPERRAQLISASLMWAFTFGQARYGEADAIAHVLTATEAPIWLFQGLTMLAYDAYFRGEAVDARKFLLDAETHYTETMDADFLSLPSYPPAALYGIRAQVNWCLGDVEGAARDSDRLLEVCRSLPGEGGPNVPPPLRGVFRDFLVAGAHAFNCLLLTLQRDFNGVLREAAAERAIVARHATDAGAETMFANYQAMTALYSEFADWMQSGQRDPAARIGPYEQHIRTFEATGPAGVSYFYYTLGELHLAAADTAGALASVERGLDHANAHREFLFQSDLSALRARATFAEDPARARRGFRDALDAAEKRQSPPLSLRAASAWAATDPGSGRGPLLAILERCEDQVSTRELMEARAIARGVA